MYNVHVKLSLSLALSVINYPRYRKIVSALPGEQLPYSPFHSPLVLLHVNFHFRSLLSRQVMLLTSFVLVISAPSMLSMSEQPITVTQKNDKAYLRKSCFWQKFIIYCYLQKISFPVIINEVVFTSVCQSFYPREHVCVWGCACMGCVCAWEACVGVCICGGHAWWKEACVGKGGKRGQRTTCMVKHPAGTAVISAKNEHLSNFWLKF